MKKFIAGLLVGMMLMTGAVYATGTKLEVSLQALKYYFDGVEKTPNSHGFVYNGTTYVPLRFIAETLGKEVAWDGNNSAIYIGEKPESLNPLKSTPSYENGTYRGAFLDSDEMQVNVQFKLEDNIIKSISFRHLQYKGINYLTSEAASIKGIKDQNQKLIDYLVGKDITESLKDLYRPGEIVTEKVDTFTGATLRASKIISAIRDGLNRGIYSY